MKSYEITITEVLRKDIKVEAPSPEMALHMVVEGHQSGKYTLTSQDRDDVKFKIEYPPLNRDHGSR